MHTAEEALRLGRFVHGIGVLRHGKGLIAYLAVLLALIFSFNDKE